MKILFLHKQMLFPHDTGGKIRALNLVRHLARWHEVTYLCNIRPGEEQHLPAMRELGVRLEAVPLRETRKGSFRFYLDVTRNVASRDPFTIARNFDPNVRQRLTELLNENDYDLVICDCCQMARHVSGIQGVTKVLFQHNVEAQILYRHVHAGGSWLRSRFMKMQWQRMRQFEGECGGEFDGVIAVSEADRKAFEKDYGWNHVSAIDTAVDLDYFSAGLKMATEKAGRVVFVGSMDWLPNQDGVRYFVKQIWPAIRASHPEATFQIVGRNPPPSVRGLSATPGVEVVGGVPDVRPFLAEAAVAVVPLLVGGGTRLKIFEAMGMRRAVVSTTIGAEGLRVNDNQHICISDTAEDFARVVNELLTDGTRRAKIAREGYDLVTREFGSEAVARQFERICMDTLGRRNARPHEPAAV